MSVVLRGQPRTQIEELGDPLGGERADSTAEEQPVFP
jgi:hypothetical protein